MKVFCMFFLIMSFNALSQQTHRCARDSITVPLVGPRVPFCTTTPFMFENDNFGFEIQRGSLVDVDNGDIIISDISTEIVNFINSNLNNMLIKGVESVNNLSFIVVKDNIQAVKRDGKSTIQLERSPQNVCIDPDSNGPGTACAVCPRNLFGRSFNVGTKEIEPATECDIYHTTEFWSMPPTIVPCLNPTLTPPILQTYLHEYTHAVGLGHIDPITTDGIKLIMDSTTHCSNAANNENTYLSSIEYDSIDFLYKHLLSEITIVEPRRGAQVNKAVQSVLELEGVAFHANGFDLSNDIRWSVGGFQGIGGSLLAIGSNVSVPVEQLPDGNIDIFATVTVTSPDNDQVEETLDTPVINTEYTHNKSSSIGNYDFVNTLGQRGTSTRITVTNNPNIPPPPPIEPSGTLTSDSPCTVQTGNTKCTVTITGSHLNIPVSCLWRTTPGTQIRYVGCTFNGLNSRVYEWTWNSVGLDSTFELKGHDSVPPNNSGAFNSGTFLDSITTTAIVSLTNPTGSLSSDSPCTIELGETHCSTVISSVVS